MSTRSHSSTGLRLVNLNVTTPSVNGIVSTKIVTRLAKNVAEDLLARAEPIFVAMDPPCHTWHIDATSCLGIEDDAVSMVGTLVARVKDLGCEEIIVAASANELSVGSRHLSDYLREIAARVGIKLAVCDTIEKADELLTERRWERLKEKAK